MKKINHLKKLLIIVLSLIISTLFSSCQGDEDINRETAEKNSETVAASITTSGAPVIEAVTDISDIKAENSAADVIDEAEYGEYMYSPPAAALDLDFCRDKIIHKLEYTYYLNDGTAGLPEYILSDINDHAEKVIEEDDIPGKGSYVLERIGVDMFDINSDGLDDYIVVGEIIDIESELNLFPYTIERLYIRDGNDGFNAIDFPASCGKGGTLFDNILSTKTNGFNDFMGFCYYDIILVTFDGNSTYSEAEILDEDYTWEYLDNGLVKISVYENNHGNEHKNEIAAAKFIYDTDYTEHMLLYSSLPDGTPSSSVIGKNGYDVFEFYVRRTDKAPEKWNDWAAGPIEIRHIPEDENNSTSESETKELLPPTMYIYYNDADAANIEDIVLPWTEEKVNEAWKMSGLSDSFTSYYDRCFADLDGDGVQELLLTVHSVSFFMAGYKIDNDEIQYLDTADFGGPIGRAAILALPPTDEETLSSSNCVHIKPSDVPYEYDMWDLEMAERDFKILRDNDGNNYFTGYGFSADNATCWVIKLDIQDSKLVWKKVYEWGYYGGAQPGYVLNYYAIDNGRNIVAKEEIDDFLAQLS